MKSKSNLPQRRATRLQEYDYSKLGAYFVTICVQHRKCLFGEIIDGKMQLNEIGEIVSECWNHIPQHYSYVGIGEYVIMPNHIHGIIAWGIPFEGLVCPHQQTEGLVSPHPQTVGARSPRPQNSKGTRNGDTYTPSLGKIVAYFKYQSTKYINHNNNTLGKCFWQRNYHDHVIRDDKDLQRLLEYIQNNPMKWELDQLHPNNNRHGIL